MTTATAPRLAGAAYAGVQHRGSHLQIITWAGSGKTEIVAQPAVPAPAEQTPAPAQSGALKVGQTHVYENGVEMTVSAPTAYTPGTHAVAGEGAAQYAKVTVTIKNGWAAVRPDHGPPDRVERRADQVYDSKVGASPDTTALPGMTIKWNVAFGAQSLDDLKIEGSPGFSDDHTVWPR
jgi:hypothetical protein